VLRGQDEAVLARLPEAVFLRRLAGLGLLENDLGDDRLAGSRSRRTSRRCARCGRGQPDHRPRRRGARRLPLRALVLRNNQIGSAGAVAIAA